MKNVKPVLGIGSSVEIGKEIGEVIAIRSHSITSVSGDRRIYPLVVVRVNGQLHEFPGSAFEFVVPNA